MIWIRRWRKCRVWRRYIDTCGNGTISILHPLTSNGVFRRFYHELIINLVWNFADLWINMRRKKKISGSLGHPWRYAPDRAQLRRKVPKRYSFKTLLSNFHIVKTIRVSRPADPSQQGPPLAPASASWTAVSGDILLSTMFTHAHAHSCCWLPVYSLLLLRSKLEPLSLSVHFSR